ncbi:MAG: hypothetical protein QXD03_02175, partial [Candidatus Anstonellales archaeon]
SVFRKREYYDIKRVHLIDEFSSSDNGKCFTFNIGGKYISEICIYKGGFVKFYCQCPSFRYQFASLLYRRGSLLHPEEFNHLNRIPRKNAVTFICKHLEACLRKFRIKILKEAL